MPTFTIEWSMGGTLTVEAETPDDAKEIVTDMPTNELLAKTQGLDFWETEAVEPEDEEGEIK